ncbi:hypothetical protein H2198_007277 [Neophaeococcomyces mojaviensis]|uniref:Uncharacterized protein n=1 Tax=Neophaeococcomyces mojaviensis TaxID=3383035 RepID=A0ACC3A0I3_9EURO|nr:hypothetical protein H2198_007277 [Knufia sp. JES_112]
MRSGMLFLISISALLTIAQAAASISIWNFDDYNYQRSCVKYALDHVGINVGCDYNECLCRTDITPMATYYLSSQIWAGCSNDKDQTSGVQVYTSYCDVFLGRAEVTTTSQSTATTTVVVYAGPTSTPNSGLGSRISQSGQPTSTAMLLSVAAIALGTLVLSIVL